MFIPKEGSKSNRINFQQGHHAKYGFASSNKSKLIGTFDFGKSCLRGVKFARLVSMLYNYAE